MELNLRRDFNLGCRSRELVRPAGSRSDVTATKRVRGRKESLRLDRILCAFAAALALVSCNNDKIEVYRIPKEGVTVAMRNGSAGLPPAPAGNPAKWVKPDGWSEQPLSEMRLGASRLMARMVLLPMFR